MCRWEKVDSKFSSKSLVSFRVRVNYTSRYFAYIIIVGARRVTSVQKNASSDVVVFLNVRIIFVSVRHCINEYNSRASSVRAFVRNETIRMEAKLYDGHGRAL